MAKKRAPEMTMDGWLGRARSQEVRQQIKADTTQEDFQAIVCVAPRLDTRDWKNAVALLHMVYGWMPTMLRPIETHTPEQRTRLLAHLNRVKSGGILTSAELAATQRFANRSIVGASKLLHVLSPNQYAIWDSRVANAFLWKGVTPAAYSTTERYEEYMNAVRKWGKALAVIRECRSLRTLNPALADASDLRLIELVLFCKVKADKM